MSVNIKETHDKMKEGVMTVVYKMTEDNIIIKRIWHDTDFYEIEFKVKSSHVSCELNTYVVDTEVNELSRKILDYINNDLEFYWEIGEDDSESCPKIIIRSFMKDAQGHVVLNMECYISSDYGEDQYKWECKIPIKTEIGLLYNFTKELVRLNKEDIRVCLWEEYE